MNSSEQNPYAAPTEPLTRPESLPRERSQELERLAQRRIRIGIALLLPGALLNCLVFPAVDFIAAGRPPAANSWAMFSAVVAIGGLILLAATALFLWLRGVALLVLISDVFRAIFGRHTNRDGWIDATLEGTLGFVPAAIVGCIVWLTYDILLFGGPWSYVFYFLFGTLAHICGAVAYVPILVQWYRYRRENRRSATLMT